MSSLSALNFIDNPVIAEKAANYRTVEVDVAKTLKSWRKSLFSFEWITADGAIRSLDDLSDKERPKRQDVEEKIAKGAEIPKPVLGIGIMDNVEIGIGRAEFLTLAAHGMRTIPVHIPQSNESDFKPFIAQVK